MHFSNTCPTESGEEGGTISLVLGNQNGNQGETQLKFVTSQNGRQILNFIRQIINLSANTKHILKHPNFFTRKADIMTCPAYIV